MRRILHIAGRPAIAILAAILMACQCVQPVPPDPTPPDPVDKRSESLKDFMKKTGIGLYIDSEGIVVYDELNYQRAWSSDPGYFRIQRDDQSAYLNISGSSASTSASYQVEYKNEGRNVTLMLLKLQSVKTENSLVWLWNETMATGVIIPAGIL